jgi:putative ABC transport system ATP-binding protein
MSYIIAEKLVKKYGNGEATVTAVSDISFQIESGEFVGVMGESGAGKSTLLSIMGAMNAPTSGRSGETGRFSQGISRFHISEFSPGTLSYGFRKCHVAFNHHKEK